MRKRKRVAQATRLVVGALVLAGGEVGLLASTNATAFAITNFNRLAAGGVVIGWTAETNSFGNVFFTVEKTGSLNSGFSPLSQPISETTSLVYTDSAPSAGIAGF